MPGVIRPLTPVGREATTQFDDLCPNFVNCGIVVNAAEGAGDQVGNDGHLRLTHPLCRD